MKNCTEIVKTGNKILLPHSTSPQLDAELLLGYVLQKDRAWLLAHPDHTLQGQALQKYNNLLSRRVAGESIAYITGAKEFYGRQFIVNKHVLVPRPESESFIELLRQLKDNNVNPFLQGRTLLQGQALQSGEANHIGGFLHSILDMGTGSGCLGITSALEFTDTFVTATDTSTTALKVAIQNAKKYDTSIVFKKQSLLTGDKQGYDVILANLPYVPAAMQDASIQHEPKQALFSGIDGLNHYRRLFKQLAPKHIRFVMTESLLTQHESVAELAKKAGYTPTLTDGLVQLFAKTAHL